MLSLRERRWPSNTPEAASVAAIRASKAGGLVVMVIARLIFESRINNYEQNKCCREVILMRAGGSKGSEALTDGLKFQFPVVGSQKIEIQVHSA